MKRLIPLWITALGGFVLIVAYFIPPTQGWGEVAAIWFDIMAAIAFILGGGNLLKVHFKKVSDKAAGWGYSILTVVSFLVMLAVGLGKVGSPPAPIGEHYGETFARVPVESIPDSLVFSVPGTILLGGVEALHHSVREQMSEADGEIRFRGWMRRDQRSALLEHMDRLEWKCNVFKLYAATQPAGALGPVAFHGEHQALSIKGHMAGEQRDALLALGGDATWQAGVRELYEKTQRVTEVHVTAPLALQGRGGADDVPEDVTYDAGAGVLRVIGPMTEDQRGALAELFPIARPMDDQGRASFLAQLGDLAPEQVAAFHRVMDAHWTVETFRAALDAAGDPVEADKLPCELYEEQQRGVTPLEPKKTVGPDNKLNPAQVAALQRFASDRDMKPAVLLQALQTAGPLKGGQEDAFATFMADAPTVGERGKTIAFAMLKVKDANDRTLPLTEAQKDQLLDPHRQQMEWRTAVGELFIAAHEVKYPWSGEYAAQGTPFWWVYEYAFKPLQATIFAMLAFYVASAAFRAFRAKNIEAILLLGTAFIILLGRTFAGVYLTQWLPDEISGLKIDNMTLTIMSVFNTAGNRAIMIGIALGIASTSLKVLLGVDRSYLGSSRE